MILLPFLLFVAALLAAFTAVCLLNLPLRRWLSRPGPHRAFTVLSLLFALAAFCSLTTACAAPTWIVDASRILPVLVDSVIALLSAIAAFSGNPEIEAAVKAMQAIAARVEQGIKDLNTLVEQYKSSPNDTLLQKIEEAANLVLGDMTQLLSDFGIPATLAAPITAAVKLMVGQLEAWITLIPIIKPSQPAGTVLALTVPLSAQTFKKQFNAALNTTTGSVEVDAALASTKRLV